MVASGSVCLTKRIPGFFGFFRFFLVFSGFFWVFPGFSGFFWVFQNFALYSNGQPSVAIIQVRRRQGVRQPKVVSGIGLWNAPGNALWNAPVRVVSGWSIYTSPQTLIPSPIDSARRVTSIPRVSDSNSHPTPTILRAFQGAFQRASGARSVGRPAGSRSPSSSFHSKRQPAVATI